MGWMWMAALIQVEGTAILTLLESSLLFHNRYVVRLFARESVLLRLLTLPCHARKTDINRLNLSSLGASDSAASSIARSVAASGNAESAASAAVRGFRSRILVLSVTPDASTQYVAMMNCIFGAQKSVSGRSWMEIGEIADFA